MKDASKYNIPVLQSAGLTLLGISMTWAVLGYYHAVYNAPAWITLFSIILLPVLSHGYSEAKKKEDLFEIYSEGGYLDCIGCVLGLFSFLVIIFPPFLNGEDITPFFFGVAFMIGFVSGFEWIRFLRLLYILYWMWKMEKTKIRDVPL